MFCEPLSAWREAAARGAAHEAGLGSRSGACEKVTLICDNLNTHTKRAYCEAFEPSRARELVRRIEFCYTPKHGSWLNIAECELSALTRQSLVGRRIGDLSVPQAEIAAWSTATNRSQRGVE